ncbi:hypothetical protein OSB04_019915 [Centaurea solstitialis]|uniref:Uncharacterized protein n=1 Tax=Centaurea solstitialis TaxID=347529 RepID=A0AA38W3D1_9ASTR|nr:hypothetical protein OSB04_019915 [Centaurea solstitialis]
MEITFHNFVAKQPLGKQIMESLRNGPVKYYTEIPAVPDGNPPIVGGIVEKDETNFTPEEANRVRGDILAKSSLIQSLPNEIYANIDCNDTEKAMWDEIIISHNAFTSLLTSYFSATSSSQEVVSSIQRLEGKLDALKTGDLAEIKGSISDMETQIRALETTCRTTAERPKRRHDDRDDPDHREGEIHKRARLGSSDLTGRSSGTAPSGTHMGTGANVSRSQPGQNPTADSAEGREIVIFVNPEISHPDRVAATDDDPSDDYESCVESYSSDSPLLVPYQSRPGMEMYSSESSPPMSPHHSPSPSPTYDMPSPHRSPLSLTPSPTYRGPQPRVPPRSPSPIQDDSPSRTPSPPVKAPRTNIFRAPINPVTHGPQRPIHGQWRQPSVSPPKVIYTREKGAPSNRRKYVEPLKSVKWDRERRRGSYLEDIHRSIFTNKVENLSL